MMVLGNFLRWQKVYAHILGLCRVNFQFYPDHFLVLACIAYNIVVLWESTYLSSISSPAANIHFQMCGPYYQHQGWTILMMFILTTNTIMIWLYYLMNTMHFMACLIWYGYNTIWQKMYHNCIWTALVVLHYKLLQKKIVREPQRGEADNNFEMLMCAHKIMCLPTIKGLSKFESYKFYQSLYTMAWSGNPHAEIWLIDGQSKAFYPVSVTRLLHGHYLKN